MNSPLTKLGLGCVTFGREIGEDPSFAIMDYAADHGISVFDTAAAYANGSSETVVGKWLRSRGMAGEIAVITKVNGKLTRDCVLTSLRKSQDRLGLDTIDAFLLHNFDPTTPLEETLEALTLAAREGHIRSAGCSNFSADQLRRALHLSAQQELIRFTMAQLVYNLVAREIEHDLLPLAHEHDIRVVTYSPLGAGFLTGKYTADRASIPAGSRFNIIPGHQDIYFKPENFQLVEKLRSASERTGVSIPQLAMRWALSNPLIDSVLVGARNLDQLAAAIEAHRNPLSPELKAELDGWSH